MKHRFARFLAVMLLAASAAAAPGCGKKLRYNIKPQAPYYYSCSAYKANLNGNVPGEFYPTGSNLLKISPNMKKDSDTGVFEVELLTDNGLNTVYGDRDMGRMTFEMNSLGEKNVVNADSNVKLLELLMPVLQKSKLKSGTTWFNTYYEKYDFMVMNSPFLYSKAVEYKYWYSGVRKLDGKRFAVISFEGNNAESSEHQTSQGTKKLTTRFKGYGDTYFDTRKGRVKKYTITKIIIFDINDAVTGELNARMNDITKISCSLKPDGFSTPGKKPRY